MMNKTAESLHSLIADEGYHDTSIGRVAWMSLLDSDGSLQLKCNKEGFNARIPFSGHPKARIGILGNERLGVPNQGSNPDQSNPSRAH